MKIALVCNYLYPRVEVSSIVSGITTYTVGLATSLSRRGHTVTVLSSSEAEEPTYQFRNHTVVPLQYSPGSPLVFSQRVLEFLSENPQDVVESHNWDSPLLLEQLFGGTPTVVRFASDLVSIAESGKFPLSSARQSSLSMYLMEQKMLSLADTVLVASDRFRNRAEASGFNSVRTLPLGIDSVTPGLPHSDRKQVVVWVARFDDQRKGSEYVRPILDSIPLGYEIVVLGSCSDATLKEELRRDYARASFFFSAVNSEDLREVFSSSVATIVPTKSESFGYVLLEPMACGCPVICFDQPGGDKDKWPLYRLGPHTDQSSLSNIPKALSHIAGNPDVCRDVSKFSSEFLWDNIIEGYEEAYGDAIRRGFLNLQRRSRGW